MYEMNIFWHYPKAQVDTVHNTNLPALYFMAKGIRCQRPQLSHKLRDSHAFRAQITLTRIAVQFSSKMDFKVEILYVKNKNCCTLNNEV